MTSRDRDRMERDARRRRERAQQHLDRVRNRRRGPAAPRAGLPRLPRLPGGPGWLVLAGLGAALLGVWTGGGALANWGEPWRVERVEVLGAERLSGREVAEAAGVALGAAWDMVEPGRTRRALAEHAWVASARVARLPGGTVVLQVREREPMAVIEARGGPVGVDVEGRPFAVLEADEARALPRLKCDNAPPPGQPDARLAQAIRVARSLPERGLELPEEITVGDERDPEGVVLRLPGLTPRVVLGNEELDERVGLLAELLAQRKSEVEASTQVDLRFAGQAVLRGEEGERNARGRG